LNKKVNKLKKYNEEINKKWEENKNIINNKIWKLSDLLIDKNIFAGSYLTYLFKRYINKCLSIKKPNWMYGDIDIWSYDKNGFVGTPTEYDNFPYHEDFNTDYIIKLDNKLDSKFDNKNVCFNYIKTPHCKNIKTLLYQFDISCCQIAFNNDICYVTLYGLYALITGINKMLCSNPDVPMLLEYIYDKDQLKKVNKLIKKTNLYDDEQWDHNNNLNIKIPTYPILCNINNATKYKEIYEKFIINLQSLYSEKDYMKSIGAKWDFQNKCSYIPSQVSVNKYIEYINKKTKEKINVQIITINNPLDMWALICLTHDKYKYHELCNTLDENNILMENAIKIISLAGVKEELYEDINEGIHEGMWIDKYDGGWGCSLEKSQIIEITKKKLLKISEFNKLISRLRSIKRINKYKSREFTFVFRIE
jgi:hypothetical protein